MQGAVGARPYTDAENFFIRQAVLNTRLRHATTPLVNFKYVPHRPTPKQSVFLKLPVKEFLYGGAAGGGKTDVLLMTALQYVHVPNYSALVLRRTFPQLNKADSILSRAHAWLRNTDARWEAMHNRYVFPSGATVEFGYLQYFKDVYQYDSSAYQTIVWDELTQFTEDQYRFLFSRLRRLKDSTVPLRVRGGTNPGGVGHLWVKERFIKNRNAQRLFLHALLSDNPHIDRIAYLSSLAELDPITRRQRELGDWDARREGTIFKREWFDRFVDRAPGENYRIRFWDLAATEKKAGAKGKDPDYVVGTLLGRDRVSRFYIEDVRRGQMKPSDVERLILNTARMDGRGIKLRIEQEPGASGKMLVDSYVRALPGYDVKGIRSSGPKLSRWMPFAAQCQAHNVSIVNGPWVHDWFEEMTNLGMDENEHDDQADSVSGAFLAHIEEPREVFGITRVGGN